MPRNWRTTYEDPDDNTSIWAVVLILLVVIAVLTLGSYTSELL